MVVGGAPWSGGDVDDHDTAIRVIDRLDVDAKPERVVDLVGDLRRILDGLRANDSTRRLVRDAEDQLAAAFVGEGDAVLPELGLVEAGLCLLELELFALAWACE